MSATQTRFGQSGSYESTPWGVLNEEFLKEYPITAGWRINYAYHQMQQNLIRIECQLIDRHGEVVCARSSVVGIGSCIDPESPSWGTAETNAFYRLMKALGLGEVEAKNQDREISDLVASVTKPKAAAKKPKVVKMDPVKVTKKASPKAPAETPAKAEAEAPKLEEPTGLVADCMTLYEANGLPLEIPANNDEALQRMSEFDGALATAIANGDIPDPDAAEDSAEDEPESKPIKAKKKVSKKRAKKKTAKKAAKKAKSTPDKTENTTEDSSDDDATEIVKFEDDNEAVQTVAFEDDNESVQVVEFEDSVVNPSDVPAEATKGGLLSESDEPSPF